MVLPLAFSLDFSHIFESYRGSLATQLPNEKTC